MFEQHEKELILKQIQSAEDLAEKAIQCAESTSRDVERMSVDMKSAVLTMSKSAEKTAETMLKSSEKTAELTIEIKELVASNKYSEKERERIELRQAKSDEKLDSLHDDYTENKPLWNAMRSIYNKLGWLMVAFIFGVIIVASTSVYVSTGGKPAVVEVVK